MAGNADRKSQLVTITLPPEIVATAKAISAAENRSLSNFVATCVKDVVASKTNAA